MERAELIELLEGLTETVRDLQAHLDPQDTTTPGCVSRGEELVQKLKDESCPQLMTPKDLKAHQRLEALKVARNQLRKRGCPDPECLACKEMTKVCEQIDKAIAPPEHLEDAMGAHFSVFNGHVNDADKRAYKILQAICPEKSLKKIEKLRKSGIMAIFKEKPPANWIPAYVALVFAFVNENRAAPHWVGELEDDDSA